MSDWGGWDGGDGAEAEKKPAETKSDGFDWDAGASTGGDSYGGGSNNRKGGGACFKCGEEGHMSRECPKGGGGGGGGSRACFKCKEEGHMSRDCPQGGGSGCFKCGEEGHMSRECPKGGGGGGGGGSRACYKCGEEGHMSRECPKAGGGGGGGSKPSNDDNGGSFDWDAPASGNDSKSNGGDGGSRACFKCKEEGHMSRDCPQGGGDKRPNDGSCFNCGEQGHQTKECPQEPLCRRCKKPGHKSNECNEEVLGPDGKPRAPIYVPKEIDEDDPDLFAPSKTGINFLAYDKIPVKLTGNNAPEPMTAFKDRITSETLLGAIEKSGYTVPTPVQKYSIPCILEKRDLMSCAQTGSGKTAAFLLPICQFLFNNPELLEDSYGQETQKPYALVVAPTRELAIQIHTQAIKFCRGSIVKPQIVYGGTSMGYQSNQLIKGTHILIATAGRLNDFIEKRKVSLERLQFFVLDEADRMIDMGFGPEMKKIVAGNIPARGTRQTLMFSATFPDEVQRLASEFLSDDYLFLAVGIVGAANSDVTQTILEVSKKEKKGKLIEILGDCGIIDRTLVFVERKVDADFLAAFLSGKGYKATSIHGDRYQSQREEALNDFRTGKMPILVATSVASRGIDIKDVRHVINYDLSKEVDDYVHRIGRTGRVGHSGKATSFYDSSVNADLAPFLANILKDSNQEVPSFLQGVASSGYDAFGVTEDIRTDVEVAGTAGEDDW